MYSSFENTTYKDHHFLLPVAILETSNLKRKKILTKTSNNTERSAL